MGHPFAQLSLLRRTRRWWLSLLLVLGLSSGCAAPPAPPPANDASERDTAGHLAYIQDGNLWVMALPDGTPQQLTDSGNASQPRWSPSGQWLTYCGDTTLHVVQADGADARELGPCVSTWAPDRDALLYAAANDEPRLLNLVDGTEQAAPAPSGVWSPDGTMLAFDETTLLGTEDSAGAPERIVRLFTASLYDAEPRELFSPGTPSPYGLRLTGWYDDVIVFWVIPQFSSSLTADGVALQALSVDGETPREIVPSMLTHSAYLDSTADQTSLAVVEGGLRTTWTNKAITVVEVASGERTRLTDADTAALFPAWSPDAQQIAYVAAPDLGADIWGGPEALDGMMERGIWLMDPDGTNQQALTNDPAYRDERPRWSADGAWLVFPRLNTDADASLWIMRTDGSDLRQVADGLGPMPAFAGESMAFGFYGHLAWDVLFDVTHFSGW